MKKIDTRLAKRDLSVTYFQNRAADKVTDRQTETRGGGRPTTRPREGRAVIMTFLSSGKFKAIREDNNL